MGAILFESFVSEPFEKTLSEMQKYEFKDESGKISLYYFIKRFIEEKKVFAQRYQELLSKYEELKKDKTEEECAILHQEHMEKLQQLLKCPSELKFLNYNAIKESISSSAQLEILSGVLSNIPPEEG